MRQRDEELLRCGRDRSVVISLIVSAAVGRWMLLVWFLLLVVRTRLILAVSAGPHHVSGCLHTVWHTGERSTTGIALGVVLIQRDGKLIRAFKHHMQEVIMPRQETEALMRVELGVKVLICVCRVQSHRARLVQYDQVLASAVPETQVIVGWMLEGVDDKRLNMPWGLRGLRNRLVANLPLGLAFVGSMDQGCSCWEK